MSQQPEAGTIHDDPATHTHTQTHTMPGRRYANAHPTTRRTPNKLRRTQAQGETQTIDVWGACLAQLQTHDQPETETRVYPQYATHSPRRDSHARTKNYTNARRSVRMFVPEACLIQGPAEESRRPRSGATGNNAYLAMRKTNCLEVKGTLCLAVRDTHCLGLRGIR